MEFSVGERLTIPSPIDVHVHLREPGGEHMETIESGTRAALEGGYQAVFDMPNNPNGNETWTEAALDKKIEIAYANSHTDIGFYAGVNLKDPAFGEFPGMVRKASGLKLYMDHTQGNTTKHTLDSVREVIDEWIIQAKQIGTRPPILLHAREGIGAETAEYVASARYPVHWCHVSTEGEATAAGLLTSFFPDLFTGGVTVHHLTMTSRNADFQQGWNGARMQPPLGEEVDAEALLYAYNKRDLKILETDHAPHTPDAKKLVEEKNPVGDTSEGCATCFGVSGIRFVLPVMMSLVQRRKTTMERLVDSLHDQPVRMLRLGEAVLNNTTTFSVRPYVIGVDDEDAYSGKSTNTPYIGWTGWADVEQVTFADANQTSSAPRKINILKAV